MSRIFGAVTQNGYVVRDIHAAMDHWVNVMGVGPWYYVDRVKTDYFRHRGVDSPVEMSIALANSGDLQIELIQQRNDAPSLYKEFISVTRLATKARSVASRGAFAISTLKRIRAPWLNSPTSAVPKDSSLNISARRRLTGMAATRSVP